MFDISNLWLFILAVFLLSVTPGPNMAYVVGQSVANGRRAGVISAAGVALGSCAHALASVAGLTAMIAASPALFTLIKYAGALYLVYLGAGLILGTLRRRSGDAVSPGIKNGAQSRELLAKGFITTLTNPKVLLFFISFFPQFVLPDGSHQAESLLLLGLVYTLVAFVTDALFALLAAGTTGALARRLWMQHALEGLVGITFVALGVRLALSQR